MGTWSYSIYLLHGLVGRRLWSVLLGLGFVPDDAAIAAGMVVAAMGASLLVGWVFFHLVEMPMAERAALVGYRR